MDTVKTVTVIDSDLNIEYLFTYILEKNGYKSSFYHGYDDYMDKTNVGKGNAIYVIDLDLFTTYFEKELFKRDKVAFFFISCTMTQFKKHHFTFPVGFHGFFFKPFDFEFMLTEFDRVLTGCYA